MTPQHPAAPEGETDASGLTEAEREALEVAVGNHCTHTREPDYSVVEVGAYAQQKEATARAVNNAARMAQVAARRTRELAAMTARAESAEAAHAALVAGVEALVERLCDCGNVDGHPGDCAATPAINILPASDREGDGA